MSRSKKNSVVVAADAKPAKASKANKATKPVADPKPVKPAKAAKPVADDTSNDVDATAKRAEQYAKRRSVGFSIHAAIDGKNTVEKIAEKCGCSVERVMSHVNWLNGKKTGPRVEVTAKRIVKPIVENISAGFRSDASRYATT